MRSSAAERVFWCEDGSGGIKRGWDGVPRRFHATGSLRAGAARLADASDAGAGKKDERCVCVDAGRLSDARLRVYDNCDPRAKSCDLGPLPTTP